MDKSERLSETDSWECIGWIRDQDKRMTIGRKEFDKRQIERAEKRQLGTKDKECRKRRQWETKETERQSRETDWVERDK